MTMPFMVMSNRPSSGLTRSSQDLYRNHPYIPIQSVASGLINHSSDMPDQGSQNDTRAVYHTQLTEMNANNMRFDQVNQDCFSSAGLNSYSLAYSSAPFQQTPVTDDFSEWLMYRRYASQRGSYIPTPISHQTNRGVSSHITDHPARQLPTRSC